MIKQELPRIREKFKPGTIVVLENMMGESQMPRGLHGTVIHVDDIGQIHVAWDNGSSLALNTEYDNFHIVEEKKKGIENVVIRALRYEDRYDIREIDRVGDFQILDFVNDILLDAKESNSEQDYCYGVFVENHLVGYCTIGGADEVDVANYDDYLLSDVFILNEYRHKGLAHKLIDYIVSTRETGKTIYADIIDDSLESFYFSMGFEKVCPGLIRKVIENRQNL